MAHRTDTASLQKLSIARFEKERTGRVRALAKALAHTLDAATALPDHEPSIRHSLTIAERQIRSQLHNALDAPNPHCTPNTRPS